MTADRASVIAGVGACKPARVIRNTDDPIASLETTDTWIRSRTGIVSRGWVADGESTGDLAVRAGRQALDQAGVTHVDLVMVATITPDHRLPATAPWVAAQLGLGTVPAFDIVAACAGFLYGLAAGEAWIRAERADRVLLIAAETMSTMVDVSDRGTAVLFADGAAAVVLRRGTADEAGAVLAVELGSDGEQKDLATVPAGGARRPDRAQAEPLWEHSLQLQGPQTFTQAVTRMTEVSRSVLRTVGWQSTHVKAFIGHQANQRILDKVADLVGIAPDSRLGNIRYTGNTSSASIPLVLAEAVQGGFVEPGVATVLTAFGGGAVWGAAAMTWPSLPPASSRIAAQIGFTQPQKEPS
ncbi:beta-ketoacyl-ACP synthase 3 [Amycolatopsis sp. PS_44_ISF1]|uniref:beta-ketoacyl-ACP synthase 3 n=1 Tax=Amycolatopsis sp. PS_44_ISF1 TaxID=2974917 RepID=UPI0028DD418C|nr:beta-ketoacyl-ACP synthase 3 [Amycolatopsis sp. PS_44_ISF1]MDT8913698.1 beta-ketoacyl-ACP synthase 3 [Amycolatopsis sp. PS_44_ISF1]